MSTVLITTISSRPISLLQEKQDNVMSLSSLIHPIGLLQCNALYVCLSACNHHRACVIMQQTACNIADYFKTLLKE